MSWFFNTKIDSTNNSNNSQPYQDSFSNTSNMKSQNNNENKKETKIIEKTTEEKIEEAVNLFNQSIFLLTSVIKSQDRKISTLETQVLELQNKLKEFEVKERKPEYITQNIHQGIKLNHKRKIFIQIEREPSLSNQCIDKISKYFKNEELIVGNQGPKLFFWRVNDRIGDWNEIYTRLSLQENNILIILKYLNFDQKYWTKEKDFKGIPVFTIGFFGDMLVDCEQNISEYNEISKFLLKL